MNKHLTARRRQTEGRKKSHSVSRGTQRHESFQMTRRQRSETCNNSTLSGLNFMPVCICVYVCEMLNSPLRWRAPLWKEGWVDLAPVGWRDICQRWRPGQNNSKPIALEEMWRREREAGQESGCKTKAKRESERHKGKPGGEKSRRWKKKGLGLGFLPQLATHHEAVPLQRCPVVLNAIWHQKE